MESPRACPELRQNRCNIRSGTSQPALPSLRRYTLFSWIPDWGSLRSWRHQLVSDGWSAGGWPKAESNLHPSFKPHSTRLGDRLIVNGVVLCQVYLTDLCPFPPCIARSKGLTLDGNVLTHGKSWSENGDIPARFGATWICRMMHYHRHFLCDCQPGTRNSPGFVLEIGWLCKIFGTGRTMTLRPLYERTTNKVVFAIVGDGAAPRLSLERLVHRQFGQLFPSQ